jgi:adenylate cyclase class IV
MVVTCLPGVPNPWKFASTEPSGKKKNKAKETHTHTRTMESQKIKNVEIKARLSTAFATGDPRLGVLTAVVDQIDTYFKCAQGRLKIREERDRLTEMMRFPVSVNAGPPTYKFIWYAREKTEGPKLSDITITTIPDGPTFIQMMTSACGVLRVVKKRREIYMRGRTRVHIDTVEGLGSYLELEVVLRPSEGIESGQIEARGIMDNLGITGRDLISGSYSDL